MAYSSASDVKSFAFCYCSFPQVKSLQDEMYPRFSPDSKAVDRKEKCKTPPTPSLIIDTKNSVDS